MRPRNPALIVGLLLLLTPPTVGNARQTEESDAVPVATFQSAVLDYVALRAAALVKTLKAPAHFAIARWSFRS